MHSETYSWSGTSPGNWRKFGWFVLILLVVAVGIALLAGRTGTVRKPRAATGVVTNTQNNASAGYIFYFTTSREGCTFEQLHRDLPRLDLLYPAPCRDIQVTSFLAWLYEQLPDDYKWVAQVLRDDYQHWYSRDAITRALYNAGR